MKNKYERLLTLLIISCVFIIGIEGYFLIDHKKPYSSSFNINSSHANRRGTPAVNVNAIRYLTTLLPGAIISSYEETVYEGNISQIRQSPGAFGLLSYDKALVLKGEKGSSVILLTQKSLDNLKITDMSGNNLGFEQLNVGEKIRAIETIDLIDQSVPVLRKINITKE